MYNTVGGLVYHTSATGRREFPLQMNRVKGEGLVGGLKQNQTGEPIEMSHILTLLFEIVLNLVMFNHAVQGGAN